MLMSSYGFSSDWTCMASLRGGEGGARAPAALEDLALGVRLGDLRDELVDEDLQRGAGVLAAGEEPVVAKQRRDRDAEAGDGRDERRGDAWRDGVHVDVACGGDGRERDH